MSGLEGIQMVPQMQMGDGAVSERFRVDGPNMVPSPMQSARWDNPRKGKCSADNNRCNGWATNATKNTSEPLCNGHAQSKARKLKAEVADESG